MSYLFVGTRFLCSVLVAPVRNESSEIILFIVNLEDITDAPLKYDSYRGSLRHSLYTSHVVYLALLLVYYRFIVVSRFSVKSHLQTSYIASESKTTSA